MGPVNLNSLGKHPKPAAVKGLSENSRQVPPDLARDTREITLARQSGEHEADELGESWRPSIQRQVRRRSPSLVTRSQR
jgi:hypothetical protein